MAKTTVMTATTELYFTPADCRSEATLIAGANDADIDTDWGHICGSGQSPSDTDVIDSAARSILAT